MGVPSVAAPSFALVLASQGAATEIAPIQLDN